MFESLWARLPQPAHFLPNRVRTYDPEEVTRIGEETDPRGVDLDPSRVETIWASVVRMYRQGLHPAIALCLRYRGQVLLDRSIGHSAGNGPADPEDADKQVASPDTLFSLFSGSKAMTAMVVHLLSERGLLQLDDRVVDYIPEFAGRGRERITLRHVLLHRAGIPTTPAEYSDPELLTQPAKILEMLCQLEPQSLAGEQVAYHALTGGFLLAEVIQRASGQDLQSCFKEAIRDPLGLENLGYGVPSAKLPQVARDCFTGPVPPRALERLLERSLGVGIRAAVSVARDSRFLTGVVPSGNVIGSADEVCRFYELLLRGGELEGVRCLEEHTVRRAVTQCSAQELDRIILLPLRYSMGFMLGGPHLSFYGPHSANAFGHVGFTNVVAWADPDRELSVALLNNGKPFVTPELLAWLNVPRVIARCIPRASKLRP